jgi:hypothetical protein
MANDLKLVLLSLLKCLDLSRLQLDDSTNAAGLTIISAFFRHLHNGEHHSMKAYWGSGGIARLIL